MKVLVITRHYVINYGSLLQTLATQMAVEKLGHEVEIIDYVRYDEHFSRVEKANIQLKPKYNGNCIKRILYLFVRQPENVFAGKRFLKERNKYLKLTDNYELFDQLKDNPPDADVYLTGSDQVWGPMAAGAYDESYFLGFIKDKKKIAYAASFGRASKEFSEKIRAKFHDFLVDYDHILVREISAKELCDEIGIKSEVAIDPTLLISASEWRRTLNVGAPIIEGKYVLVYQVHNDKRLDDYAKRFAKNSGLKLIRVSPFWHQIIRGGDFICCPSVSEFINILSNSSCLITDSFHGTVFAINFNIPFIEVMPNNTTGTRNKSILELCSLEGRILKDDNVMMDLNVDFSYANEFLSNERNKCMNQLKDAIEN